MLSPRPSSRTAPSTWYAAVAAPQKKPRGKVPSFGFALVCIVFAKLLNRSSRSYAVYRPPQAGGMRVSETRRDRVTIRDIAERAGVSKGAVSYALNGQPGRLRATARADPLDRRRARLVSEPRRTRALGRARRRVRARARPPGAHARARAVLHGVHRGRRVGARAPSIALTIQLVADVARGDRGLQALVGRAPRRRRAHGRPAHRRPSRRRARPARPSGRRDRRTAGKRLSTSGLARRSVRRDRGRAVPRRPRPRADRAGRRRQRLRPHAPADGCVPRRRRRISASSGRSSRRTTAPRTARA